MTRLQASLFAIGALAVGLLGFQLGVTSSGRRCAAASPASFVHHHGGGGGGALPPVAQSAAQPRLAAAAAAAAAAAPAACPDPPPLDTARLSQSLRDSTWPVSYEKTTICEDLGRACIMGGGDVLLYEPRFQPADGRYRPIETNVTAALGKMLYHVFWGEPSAAAADAGAGAGASAGVTVAGNADQYLGTMKRHQERAGLRLWPGGAGAAPPAPFSAPCAPHAQPLVLFWDFPENFYHGMATLAALWAAHEAGAVDLGRVSLALGLPFAPARGVPRWLADPLRVMMRAAAAMAEAPPAPARHVAPLSVFAEAVAAAVAPAPASDGGGELLPRLAQPAAACFASLPVCAVSSFLRRPVPGLFRFMQLLKARLLADAFPELAAEAPAAAAAAPYVTGPDGVLRVTLAVRSDEGSRRLLSTAELLAGCRDAGTLALAGAAGPPLRVACRTHAFGSAPQGLAADAAAMHATDVLVAVHGAGLTNLGFLRPGATVLELRPSKFRADNGDRFYRPMAAESGCLKWWGVVLFRSYEPKGRLEQAGQGDPDQWGRDHDLLLPWRGLAEALGKALPLAWPAWAAAERAGKVITEIAPGERGYR